MAEIKRVVRSAPLSDFRQTVPDAGGGFRLMAELADTAYEFLKPGAIAEQEAAGAALGSEIARQQIGDPKGAFTVSRMNRPAGPNQGLANDVMGAIGKGDDRELLAKTLQAEAGGEGYNGMLAAGAVIGNRAKSGGYGDGINGVIMKPGQFSAWNGVTGYAGGEGAINMDGIKPSQDAYSAADAILSGQYEDPTGGATHYYNPAVADPNWGQRNGGNWTAIGNHIFGNADAGRGGPSPSGGTSTVVSTMNAEAPPPTMLRDADGALTARLYSPLAGEILQAHNAAAGVAYQSDIMLKGAEDMMALSNQFMLNPDGFQQAAKGYVDQIVAAAPDMFKAAIRGNFQKEAQRRYLGMVEEKQRDTRQRANNSSAALVDRWKDNLVSAMVGGNPDEIAAAQSELTGILSARESLPGVAWTREQSQNTIIKAGEAAAKEVAKRQKDQVSTWKGDLSLIGKAAMNGQAAADEAILQNPIVRQQLPDEWAEAASKVMLRDNMPSFLLMTPAEQREALAEMKAQPVQADWEMDLLKAATDAAAANAKAWEEDPITRAGEVLMDKPPALTNINPEDPSSAITAMQERAAYADDLVTAGYTDTPIYLSDQEAEMLGQAMSKETPPELRAVMAAAIVEGFGAGADRVFSEIKSDDPTTKYAGKLMARGGDKSVAFEAMRGQSMLDEGLVQAPPMSSSLSAISPDISAALSIVPIEAQSELRKFAVSIYAARARGVTDAEDQKAIMEGAVQSALGQSTNKRGKVTGGVQTVGDNPVLLPPSVSGEAAQNALQSAFSSGQRDLSGLGAFAQIGAALLGQDTAGELPQQWIGDNMPMLGGKPLNPKLFNNGNIRLVPTKGSSYRMEVTTNGAVTDARNAAGGIFEFDLSELIAEQGAMAR